MSETIEMVIKTTKYTHQDQQLLKRKANCSLACKKIKGKIYALLKTTQKRQCKCLLKIRPY